MTPLVVLSMLSALLTIFVQMGIQPLFGIALFPLGLMVVLCSLGLQSYFKLRHKTRPKEVSKRRMRVLLISALILGASWGVLNVILLSQGSFVDQTIVIIFACLAGFASIGINSVRVALGFSMPVMLITWGAVLWFNVMSWVVGSLLFGLGTTSIIQFVLAARRTTITNIKLTLENTQVLNERLEAEEKLRLAESKAAHAEQKRQAEASEMQRNMINAIAFPMVLSHGNDALEVTPAGREQFRVSDGPLEDVHLSDFFVNPQDQNRMIELLQEKGRLDNYEVLMRDAEGNQFWTVASMRPLKYDGKDCWLNSIYVIDARKRMEQDLAIAKDEAEAMLSELKTTQNSLIHAEKMASLGQLTAGIAHEIKNPLNFVNNFAKLSAEMLDELKELLEAPIAAMEEDDREDAEDLLSTVRGNLLKIDEHGKRADSIVKNMLLHSREGPGEKQHVDLGALAVEALNLAYHGARASDSSFNVDMKTEMAADLPSVECHPQDLQRVFLNLCSNGMYEAVKHSNEKGETPMLRVASKVDGDNIVIEISDNGGGVPEEIRDKIFQPFFTTKPTGEGTGLGLSMSYDIVQQHGGQLSLESETGKGTTFRVSIPVGVSTGEVH